MLLVKAYGVCLVHLEAICDYLTIEMDDFLNWLDYCYFPYMLVKHPRQTYIESEAFQRVLYKWATKEQKLQWKLFSAPKAQLRTLSKSDKCEVAASQAWRCARCLEQLDATFEVDHVLQFCLTADDSKHNLQALHAHCHRMKTKDDLYLLNPHFGYAANERLQSDEQHRIELKDAVQETKTKRNVFSNYFLEAPDTI